MIYGRIVIFVNAPSVSVIRPNWVTKIFVIGDVLAFFMQAGGGGMVSSASTASLGQKVILGGLAFQLLFFRFFLIIALIFRSRMNSSTPIPSHSSSGRRTWQNLLKLHLDSSLTHHRPLHLPHSRIRHGQRRLPNEERTLRLYRGRGTYVFGAGYVPFHTCR